MNLEQHLTSRHFSPDKSGRAWIDNDENIITFPLWNMSGQLVGYQHYRPLADKLRHNHPKEGRYFTHISKGQLAVFGLESLIDRRKPLYLCEGIFDACRLHYNGLQAIGVLTSNPQHLREWLKLIGFNIIPCVQGDVASKQLMQYSSHGYNIFLPEGEDVGSISDEQFKEIFL